MPTLTATQLQQQRRAQLALHKKILTLFKAMGFVYRPTEHIQFHLGGRDMEMDAVFAYENIFIICEDTLSTDTAHLRTKNDTMQRIKSNKADFFRIMDERVDNFSRLHECFDLSRIKLFYIHICGKKDDYSKEEMEEFPDIKLWGLNTLDYFKWLSECIHKSTRFELFRYLGLAKCDIGPVRATADLAAAQAPIIYPQNFVGPIQGCRVVTFMLSAQELLEMSYVLRKEGWAKRSGLYQRLLDKKKMGNIRDYIAQNKSSFFNNIVVALPDSATILDAQNQTHSIFDLDSQNTVLRLSLPYEYNSICLIDGQHRVYAYHEGGSHEDAVAPLRRDRHLLVTGVMFPPTMEDGEKLKLQSQIFLDINKNAKPISANLLLYIQKLQNPLADTSIAQDVLESMNEHGVFKDQFQKSTLNSHGIKTASIIKFAMRYVVGIEDENNKESLIYYWPGNKNALKRNNIEARNDYISFCVEWLNKFFSGVKQAWHEHWNTDNSTTLLPSVVTINGCLIAYRRQLKRNGLKNTPFFATKFSQWTHDFEKETFGYRSSQYGRFAKDLLKTVFGIDECQDEASAPSENRDR